MKSAANKNSGQVDARTASVSSNQPNEGRDDAALFAECDKDHGAEADQARRIAEDQGESPT
jgi:hypothetical protein